MILTANAPSLFMLMNLLCKYQPPKYSSTRVTTWKLTSSLRLRTCHLFNNFCDTRLVLMLKKVLNALLHHAINLETVNFVA